MKFRNVFAIVFVVSLVILAANATQKPDDNESEQKNYSSKSKDAIVSSDSKSFINSDSWSSLNSKSKSSLGSTFSENRRKTRGIPALYSKVMPASESVITGESHGRKTRSVDDNTNIETTPLPLENSTRSDSDNANIAQEQVDDDDSQGTTENLEATTKDSTEIVTDAPVSSSENSMEGDGTFETPAEAPVTEREQTPVPASSENLNGGEQTTITSDLPSVMPSTSEENHNDIEVDSKESTTVSAIEAENFKNENEGASTANDDNLTVMSLTERNDGDILESTENSGNSESSTNAEDTPDIPATENTDLDDITEINTEDEFNSNSTEDNGATEIETEIPTDYTTDTMDTTMESLSSETTIVSTSTTSKPIEKPKKNYNYLVYDDKSNIPCTLANMSISLRVSYSTKHNRTVTSEFPVPGTVNANGTCGKKQSDLTLSWPSVNSDNPGENAITFQIMNDGAFFYVNNVKVNITLDSEDYSNAAEASLAGNSTQDLRLFSAPLKNGFHVCPTTTEIPCGKIVVTIKDVSLIAYNDRKDHSNREQEVCQHSKTVSIAAILGGLVAIAITVGIVASYIWYRKRANTFRSELP